MLRSIAALTGALFSTDIAALRCVSKHEADLILRDASLRDAPQDEAGLAYRAIPQ
jgi:hypothetical protein